MQKNEKLIMRIIENGVGNIWFAKAKYSTPHKKRTRATRFKNVCD